MENVNFLAHLDGLSSGQSEHSHGIVGSMNGREILESMKTRRLIATLEPGCYNENVYEYRGWQLPQKK